MLAEIMFESAPQDEPLSFHPLRRAMVLASELEALLGVHDALDSGLKYRLRLARAQTLNVVDELRYLLRGQEGL
jgi:hypothetical protein